MEDFNIQLAYMSRNSALPFTTYAQFLHRHFPQKVQKLPVDAGCGCPVRDGTLGVGGCAFCNGRSFLPHLQDEGWQVRAQLDRGKRFFARKISSGNPTVFLAYFQAGTNTYAPVREMMPRLEEALAVEGVGGLVIATRPDCLTEAWLQALQSLSRRTFVMVELGVESLCDATLDRAGRGHTARCSLSAIETLTSIGVHVGIHLILGLPGDTPAEWMRWPAMLADTPVEVIKFHQLQILRGSRLAAEYLRAPEQFTLLTPEVYVASLADFLERLPARVAVDRLASVAKADEIVAPRWGLRPDDLQLRLVEAFRQRCTYQGCLCR